MISEQFSIFDFLAEKSPEFNLNMILVIFLKIAILKPSFPNEF